MSRSPKDQARLNHRDRRVRTKVLRFIDDCGDVTEAIELYAYRLVIVGYGLWHICHKLIGQ